ncbi:aminotransferase class V-fold PLP-dependent enzyme [Streptosporangium sp. NPDC006013]|uniref:aminotransferase class V-fold PLP-dependent enzyme n=1 Tax=Streptosporangium sp. NPDC006013 TaxID=3155596 RepID=UPI0033B36311
MIYLDHAATSLPKPPVVVTAMQSYLETAGNPGRSGHRPARAAEEAIWDARRAVADLLSGDEPDRVIFTVNATTAMNTALNGLLGPGDRVLTSAFEHNSTVRPVHALTAREVSWTVVPPAPDSPLDLERLEAELARGGVRVVTVAHASNVTGAVIPLKPVHALARHYGAALVVDAAQTVGHLPVHVDDADVMVFAGHKGLFGPQGTGGMYVSDRVVIRPLVRGGTGGRTELRDQPRWLPWALESGTPNGPGVVGLGAAARVLRQQDPGRIRLRERDLYDLLMSGARQVPGVTWHGWPSTESPTPVVSITFAGLSASDASALLEERHDILVRGGLHCAPLAHETLGTAPGGTVRMSLSHLNTEAEVKAAIEGITDVAALARSLPARNGTATMRPASSGRRL